MDPKFKSSFIPKSQTASYEDRPEKASFFGVFAAIIFTLSVLSAGGLYVYKKILEKDVANLENQLASAEESIDKKGIEDILAFNGRLQIISQLLANHVAVSRYLDLLDKNTISQLQFKNLKYGTDIDGVISVEMNGNTTSYAAVALQENVFSKLPEVLSIKFDNLNLNRLDGTISFNFKGKFSKSTVGFKLPLGYFAPEDSDKLSAEEASPSVDLSGLPEDINTIQ